MPGRAGREASAVRDEDHRLSTGLITRLAVVAVTYVVLLVCALTISPNTPWVVVLFLVVSLLNRYVTYCVVWRVVRDTGRRARPSTHVRAVVSLNLVASLAVVVQWLVRASGESAGDVFPVGAACVTIASCCWVGRAAYQLMFGAHRWSWSPADMAYPWTHAIPDANDELEGDMKTPGLSDNPLSGYLLSQCNDAADEYYRQTTELMDTVHSARAALTDDAPVEEKVMSVYSVAAAASRRKDIAADGARLSGHLRDQEPHAETAIDEPWNSPGADTLIAEAWDIAAGEQRAGESPVLDWLVGHVDELLNDGAPEPESALAEDSQSHPDRLDPQDNDS